MTEKCVQLANAIEGGFMGAWIGWLATAFLEKQINGLAYGWRVGNLN